MLPGEWWDWVVVGWRDRRRVCAFAIANTPCCILTSSNVILHLGCRLAHRRHAACGLRRQRRAAWHANCGGVARRRLAGREGCCGVQQRGVEATAASSSVAWRLRRSCEAARRRPRATGAASASNEVRWGKRWPRDAWRARFRAPHTRAGSRAWNSPPPPRNASLAAPGGLREALISTSRWTPSTWFASCITDQCLRMSCWHNHIDSMMNLTIKIFADLPPPAWLSITMVASSRSTSFSN